MDEDVLQPGPLLFPMIGLALEWGDCAFVRAGIPYKVSNIQEDPAAQAAVRRDSNGYRLPVVFVAGEPVGGRAELTNLISSGELKKKVWPS